MAEYTYSITNDTLNGVLSIFDLQQEIQAVPELAAKYQSLQVEGGTLIPPVASDTLIIITDPALTAGEEVQLTLVIAAHTGINTNVLEDRKVFDVDVDFQNQDLYNVNEIDGVNFSSFATTTNNHIANVSNPHATTATQVGAIPTAEKAQPNGVATLDGTGLIPESQVPDVSVGGQLSGTLGNAQVNNLTLGSEEQGALAYYTGTSWEVLPPGTAAQFLRSQGPGADPIWASPPASPFANSYTVAKGGTGDFDTIEDALAVANPLSGSGPQAIFVYPGMYQENPLSVNSDITIEAQGRVEVEALDNNSPLFSLSSSCRLRNLNYRGPTNEACVVTLPGTTNAVVEGGLFISGSVGLGVNIAGTTLVARDFQILPGVSTSMRAVNGTISATGFLDRSSQGTVTTGSTALFSLSSCRFIGNAVSIFADDGAEIQGVAIKIQNATVGIQTGTLNPTMTKVEVLGLQVFDSTVTDIDQQGVGTVIGVANGFFRSARVNAVDYDSLALFYLDETPGEQALQVSNELHVGTVERPSEMAVGEGDSTAQGMVVITTDNTTTSTTEGGNLTDVSVNASSIASSTFTFQGMMAGHSILVGLDRQRDGSPVRFWGLKVNQTTAGVLGGGGWVFERWTGTAWESFKVMAVSDVANYRYSDQVFLRANSSEQIRFGLTESSTWATKLIDGRELYWIRIRLTALLTSRPVFEQFKVHTSRIELTERGVLNQYGPSRYYQTFLTTGNTFGESGGVSNYAFNVGSGLAPTGWSHVVKNSELNNNGDAIYMQFILPRGIDTSLPINVRVVYVPTFAGVGNATMILSILPLEVAGTLIADPAGGIVPIQRTLATTETTTSKVAQTRTSTTVGGTTNNQIRSVQFTGFDVSSYYEGDLILIRVEMDDDGVGNLELGILPLEISFAKWTPGERS